MPTTLFKIIIQHGILCYFAINFIAISEAVAEVLDYRYCDLFLLVAVCHLEFIHFKFSNIDRIQNGECYLISTCKIS